METNALELLPKLLTYKGNDYFLRVWVTAWGNLCVGYKELGSDKKILSYVVESNKEPYIPDIIEETEESGLNEHIGNNKTLNKCITNIITKINKMVENNEIIAEY